MLDTYTMQYKTNGTKVMILNCYNNLQLCHVAQCIPKQYMTRAILNFKKSIEIKQKNTIYAPLVGFTSADGIINQNIF